MTTQQSTNLAFSGRETLTAKLRGLAQRPVALTVGDRDRRADTGRDTSRAQRLSTWTTLIGAMTFEEFDGHFIHAARTELQQQPALAYKGVDFQKRSIFKPKRGNATKATATLNRGIDALSAACTRAIEQRLAPRGWARPCRGVKRLTEADGRVQLLSENERQRLFAASKASDYLRLYALVLTTICTTTSSLTG